MNLDDARAAIRTAARRVSPDDLLAAASADGCTVQRDHRAQPIAAVYDAAGFVAALAGDADDVLGAALRGLARRDLASVTDLAFALAHEPAGVLRHAALLALSHGTDDRTLALLVTALDEAIPRAALDRAVHPEATARVRAVLAAEGPASKRGLVAIAVLGARDDAASIDAIAGWLAAPPSTAVGYACAHALAAMRDPRAHAALDARWTDATYGSICVRAALRRDLVTAWDRFAPHTTAVVAGRSTDADDTIVARVLFAIHGGATPRRIAPADDPLVVDPRWIELAARLRRDPVLGASARRLLEVVPRAEVVAAIERTPLAPPPVAPAPIPARRDWVARYRAGEHAVWTELIGHAAAIVQHAELRAEAYAVAELVMQRVRANRDAVRATLTASGCVLRAEAPPAGDADLARITRLFGPLPVAVEAFYRVVGSLSLLPGGPDPYAYGPSTLEADGIALLALDPLEVCALADLAHDLDDHEAACAETHPELVGPFELRFAPDYLHKQNISGGPPYSLTLPPAEPRDAVDPALRLERMEAAFVPYLRHAFRWGGFPILEVAHAPQIGANDALAFRGVTGDAGAAADRLLAALRADLVAF